MDVNKHTVPEQRSFRVQARGHHTSHTSAKSPPTTGILGADQDNCDVLSVISRQGVTGVQSGQEMGGNMRNVSLTFRGGCQTSKGAIPKGRELPGGLAVGLVDGGQAF
ncbi:hypothetical protein AGIG_G24865 [Arapaima gigas]